MLRGVRLNMNNNMNTNTQKYSARETINGSGTKCNTLMRDGEFLGDFLFTSDAEALAAKLNEHAALVAVAEAAASLLDLCKCDSVFAQRGACKQTEQALTNLAAVRAEGGAK